MNLEVDKNKIKKGLYIVATPIGNLSDITFRAIKILENSDYIACEDTRVSKKLLNAYKINKELISNHKFNEKKNVKKIIQCLKNNNIVSLISDAGTPTISDPGKILINECIQNNIDIYPIPGASSVSAAISVSGFSDNYYFHGFVSDKINSVSKEFQYLSQINSSLVFFISSKKINKIIDLIKNFFEGRKIIICKEITKFYEEYFRSEVKDLKPFNNLRGEITVIISEKKNNKKDNLSESDKKIIKKMINKNSIKDIVTLICRNKNISKRLVYNYCLNLRK
tara:strand:- start:2349 stop:3191 length:843 start_codon:yes stop_codon:yes gene_type:complete